MPPPPTAAFCFHWCGLFPIERGVKRFDCRPVGHDFFNATANFNVLPIFSEESHQFTTTNITATGTNVVTTTKTIHDHSFSSVAYTTNAHPHYVTLQLGVDRVQTLYKDWSVKLHADGQWADGPLFSNEQYGMGGTASVRGYLDGQALRRHRLAFLRRTTNPLVQIGMVGNEGHEDPCWVRASAFLDYGGFICWPSHRPQRQPQIILPVRVGP